MLPRGGPGSIYQANGSTPAHAGPSTRQTYSSSATSHCKHHHSYQRTRLNIWTTRSLKLGREKFKPEMKTKINDLTLRSSLSEAAIN